MQVKEILRVKGNRLLSIEPTGRAVDAVFTMADQNLGSLVVVDQGRMVGVLTFHEVMQTLRHRHWDQGQRVMAWIAMKKLHVDEQVTPHTHADRVREAEA